MLLFGTCTLMPKIQTVDHAIAPPPLVTALGITWYRTQYLPIRSVKCVLVKSLFIRILMSYRSCSYMKGGLGGPSLE